jgi:hypothetical protein
LFLRCAVRIGFAHASAGHLQRPATLARICDPAAAQRPIPTAFWINTLKSV